MVSWTSKSERLLRQCQGMLTGLGVRSSIYPIKVRYKGELRPYWNLAIRDRTAIRKFRGMIPARSSRTRKLIASNVPPRGKKDTATGIVEWDKVVSVEPGLAQPTVWIEVADYHTHITGGIISHNTGKGIYPETGLQLAALANAEFRILPDGTELERKSCPGSMSGRSSTCGREAGSWFLSGRRKPVTPLSSVPGRSSGS